MRVGTMKRFLETYQQLNSETLHLLGEIYTDDIHFTDPAHELIGLDSLTACFASLYKNIITIEFSFELPVIVGEKGAVEWQMVFRHKKIAGGKQLAVDGASFIECNEQGKVCRHRDYFDLGAMVYEHIPVVGSAIRTLKKRIAR